MEYVGTKTPVEGIVDAEYALVDIEGKKTFVQTNPIQLAREFRRGEITVVKTSGTILKYVEKS